MFYFGSTNGMLGTTLFKKTLKKEKIKTARNPLFPDTTGGNTLLYPVFECAYVTMLLTLYRPLTLDFRDCYMVL